MMRVRSGSLGGASLVTRGRVGGAGGVSIETRVRADGAVSSSAAVCGRRGEGSAGALAFAAACAAAAAASASLSMAFSFSNISSFSIASIASVTALLPESMERAFRRIAKASSRLPFWSSSLASLTRDATFALFSVATFHLPPGVQHDDSFYTKEGLAVKSPSCSCRGPISVPPRDRGAVPPAPPAEGASISRRVFSSKACASGS